MGADAKAVTRARATPEVTAARVNIIADRMRGLLWRRGETAEELAKEWGLATATVEGLAAEAWRRICAEAVDIDSARPNIAGTMAVALQGALDAKQYKAMASLGDTWHKIATAAGGTAPDLEAMTDEDAVVWLEDRIAKLTALRDERLERMHVVPAQPCDSASSPK